MKQSLKYMIALFSASFILTTVSTGYLQWAFGDWTSFSQKLWLMKGKIDREWCIGYIISYIWFAIFGRVYMSMDKELIYPFLYDLGFRSFRHAPPSGIIETLSVKTTALLAERVTKLLHRAFAIFGRAGIFSCVSLLLLYKYLNYIPVSMFSLKSLMLIAGGYLWGMYSGGLLVENAHIVFSENEIIYLLRFHNKKSYPSNSGPKNKSQGYKTNHDAQPSPEQAYQLLGVSRYASWEEVKKVYKSKIAKTHPDKVNHMSEKIQEEAKQETLKLNKAIEIIKKSRGIK